MVSLLKNQLLKHLSRFTKNLSADRVNLSTFRGEGELFNLELDEIVLMDLLELPCWLRLQSAWCNKVSFRIPWTQLKKVPIVFSLDEVNIIVETCEEIREMNMQGPSVSAPAVPGKYSFVHKIIDGITVEINTVHLVLNSPAFTANVQINKILLVSKDPKWRNEATDLRLTRIKDSKKGQVLVFKELRWQNVRIEAKSTVDKDLYPLRLLSNEARCRIIIKKRLLDSFILGSRLVIVLNSLIWVLTDSQLKAAMHFLGSLEDLVKKATELSRKRKAARKLEELPEYRVQNAQQHQVHNNTSSESDRKSFSPWDVVETSYHFIAQAIDLHLCDDPGNGRSIHPNLRKGGALRMSLKHFQIDFYPYHLPLLGRRHWPTYKANSVPHEDQTLNLFNTRLMGFIGKLQPTPVHTPLIRSGNSMQKQSYQSDQNTPSRQTSPSSPTNQSGETISSLTRKQLNKIMTSCIVLRIEQFTVYKVTTSDHKLPLKECITDDGWQKNQPQDSKIVHAEFTYFYYPNDTPFPLPAPKFYLQINPITVVFDLETCLWFSSFFLNLQHSLLSSKQKATGSNLTYIDVKVEAMMPKIVFESNWKQDQFNQRPKSLTLSVTRATITNERNEEKSSRADLAKCVDVFYMGSLFFGFEFPSDPKDIPAITQKFLDHISAEDNVRSLPKNLDSSDFDKFLSQLTREFMWTEAKDVWSLTLDPVCGSFHANNADKIAPFLDSVPITIWVHSNHDPNSTIESDVNSNADIQAIAHISNLVSIQLNHHQYLFLLRLLEVASELSTFLSLDSKRIGGKENEHLATMVVAVLLSQIEVTFVMPSAFLGKGSSGGDSIVPESSLGEAMTNQKEGTVVWDSNMTIASISPQSLYNKRIESATINNNKSCESVFEQSSEAHVNEDRMSVSYHDRSSISSKDINITKQQSISNFTNAGFSSVKKGFSTFITSIDNAFKPPVEDSFDTISVRSDQSSDSESFLVLGIDQEQIVDNQFVAFEFEKFIEAAAEVTEEGSNKTSGSDHSLTSSYQKKDPVCVSTFRLNKVEFLQQSLGFSSSIKVQVANVAHEGCGSIPWDEFQSKFSSRARVWSGDRFDFDSTSTQVKLRMDHVVNLPSEDELPFISPSNLNSMFTDLLVVKVNDIKLSLPTSIAVGLVELLEDDCVSPPMPMQVSATNIFLNLIEDRNITQTGASPTDLNVHEIFITRDDAGTFHITSKKDADDSQNQPSQTQENLTDKVKSTQLQLQNIELQRRLAAFERISEENRTLRRALQETDFLKSSLAKSQENVGRLLEEKRRLLNEVHCLQQQQREPLRNSHRPWDGDKG